jgi:hypothetical protein
MALIVLERALEPMDVAGKLPATAGWQPIVFGRADARRDVMRRRGY